MKAEDFVEKLRALEPSIDELRGLGISADEAEVIRHMFRARKLPKTSNSSNELIRLIELFDVGSLEIGPVYFLSDPLVDEKRFPWVRLGRVGSDWLVLDSESGEILVEQHDCEYFVVWKCAKSAGQFLDALYYYSQSRNPERTGETACDKTLECAELAGGLEYLPFYEMLLDQRQWI